MTVCVATMCRWNYGTVENPIDGNAVILATDRMITAGDVQYEPAQIKAAHVAPHIIITVAGDYGYHSQAIKQTVKQCDASSSPYNVAMVYAQSLQTVRRNEAEALFLAPVNLNTDTFLAQQKDFADSFVHTLREQLQSYKGEEAEAIIIGSETIKDRRTSRIFTIDNHGIVRCCDDVGFAAIGSGAAHALSRLMQVGYTNTVPYFGALSAAFAAKKAAEIAPGVGKQTDMHLVLRDHNEYIVPETIKEMESIYSNYEAEHAALTVKSVAALEAYLQQKGKGSTTNAEESDGPRANAQANAGANPPTAEAARPDEAAGSEGTKKEEPGKSEA